MIQAAVDARVNVYGAVGAVLRRISLLSFESLESSLGARRGLTGIPPLVAAPVSYSTMPDARTRAVTQARVYITLTGGEQEICGNFGGFSVVIYSLNMLRDFRRQPDSLRS